MNTQHAEESYMFSIMNVNALMEKAASQPVPAYLYDKLILEGESTTIFGDTNSGKSVLAVQIANEISKTRRTLYLDLEMSAKQFQMRYTNEKGDMYTFEENLFIAHLVDSPIFDAKTVFEQRFIDGLEEQIHMGVKCIILDNMSMLYQGDTDNSSYVAKFVAALKQLCKEYFVTLILIDHTKKRNHFTPISLNDLNGSKMKSNLVDNVLVVSQSSQGKEFRYIKHLKSRSSEIIYTELNVAVHKLVKKDSFLCLDFLRTDNEYNHLRKKIKIDKNARNNRILELKEQDIPNTQIAKIIQDEYNIDSFSEGAVRKILKELKEKENQ